MRKIFVVLMILAIAGGGFAQEENKGTWGTISGESQLSTTIDFWNNANGGNGPDDDPPHLLGMDGGPHDNWFKLTWDYEKDEWSIHLPLHIKKDYFGIERNDDGDALGKITYSPDSPLTIEIPFAFEFHKTRTNDGNSGDDKQGFNWLTEATTLYDVGLTGTYETDEFMFKLGFKDILSDNPAIGAVGGWYKINDAITLAVSHQGATGTEWFRTSKIVFDQTPFGDTWENINDNGIAVKFDIMDGLSAGLSFAGALADTSDPDPEEWSLGSGQAGGAIFGAGTDDFVKDFLANPIIGVKFDGSPFKASLMAGLWTFMRDSGNDNKLVSNVPLYLGLELNLDAGLYFGADLSALFVGQTKAEKDANEKAVNDFNFGLEVMFDTTIGENPFWAGARLRALDVGYNADDFGKYYSTVSAELYVGFNWARDGDPTHGIFTIDKNDAGIITGNGVLGADWGRFGGRGSGFGARLWLGIPDLDVDPDAGLTLNLVAALGYGADITEKLGLGINAMFGLSTNPKNKAEDEDWVKGNIFGFKVVPELEWRVVSNGNITFKYELGANDLILAKDVKAELDINKFTIGFKWWL